MRLALGVVASVFASCASVEHVLCTGMLLAETMKGLPRLPGARRENLPKDGKVLMFIIGRVSTHILAYVLNV